MTEGNMKKEKTPKISTAGDSESKEVINVE